MQASATTTSEHRETTEPVASGASGISESEVARRVLELSDVYLLTAASAGHEAVPGLNVVLDGSGMTVRKPDGSVAAGLQWPAISRLDAHARMRTPSGSQGVVVEAVASTRTHRFLVPTGDPGGLEREVSEIAGALVTGRRRLFGVLFRRIAVRCCSCYDWGRNRADCPGDDGYRELLTATSRGRSVTSNPIVTESQYS